MSTTQNITQQASAKAIGPAPGGAEASRHVAFLTPEFVTDYRTGGGLGAQVYRFAKGLLDAGHRPEVFVLHRHESDSTDCDGFPVHRVHLVESESLWRLMPLLRQIRKVIPHTYARWVGAQALARAMERRGQADPFDLVVSADFRAVGLSVKKRPGRRHAIWCCWDAYLWGHTDAKRETLDFRWGCRLERRAIRKADLALAPSEFLRDYCWQHYRLAMHIVRPPMYAMERPADVLPGNIPARYLIHYGLLGARKGTDVIAQALPLAWREEPELTMVWAGKELDCGLLETSRAAWGGQSDRVLYLGAVERGLLYSLVARSLASVLPSRVDNLPNTVIESLELNVPVIGSQGASIDEVIEDGVNGRLVPIGDAQALAQAMVAAWRGQIPQPVLKGKSLQVMNEMEPGRAVQNLLQQAGLINFANADDKR